MSSAAPDLPDEGERDEELPRMTLLDHLDELRRRLFNSIIAVLIAFLACWYFSPWIFSWLERPIIEHLPPGDQLARAGGLEN